MMVSPSTIGVEFGWKLIQGRIVLVFYVNSSDGFIGMASEISMIDPPSIRNS